ncbi:DUF6737 family protein [Gloeothece verrucosa]|uniref:DUF6737 domain-containing protein n=1 Tax=Gloeothece verrucosa (strain PCC 7822) TaxID=497965 RepID=E0UK45_GLOV7|nr:DUF6737 family protein [Gloeothece verrucosa]ADN14681.1 hypothetical protein Cyan7822_2714 [Gloeothece verrucosa PCC 7822]
MSQFVNPWNYKPWWCQPWSILLTGILIVGGSWLIFKIIWLTLLVAIPIVLWWVYFLLIWPKLVRESLMQAKNNATNP